MTLHDAAMTRLLQWWKRNVRTGYGYALGASMHGGPPEYHGVRAVRSIVLWALALPLLAIVLARRLHGASIAMLAAIYIIQGFRIMMSERAAGRPPADARLYATFTLLGKAPQLIGVAKFWLDRARGVTPRIIEYKEAGLPV
jgi:hypothetical protein